MKGEGGDLPENLGRDEPERHDGPRQGVNILIVRGVARVVGERARLHHAQRVCVLASVGSGAPATSKTENRRMTRNLWISRPRLLSASEA